MLCLKYNDNIKIIFRANDKYQWRNKEFFRGGGGVQQIKLRTGRMGIWGR